MLEIKGLSFAYETDKSVLRGVDLSLGDGQVGILLGRNGVGKSTLLKIITGVLKPSAGSVRFDGRDLLSMTRRERASLVAYVPQQIDFGDLTVYQTVLTGRVSYYSIKPSKADLDVVERVIAEMDLGEELINTRTGKRVRVGRLIKMHASEMEDISECGSGEIAALFGIDCASGDTFCGAGLNYAMTSMFVPNPVISLAILPKDKKSQDNMSKAINRFMKEDPTFQCYVDPESNQTIIKGMGELHLDVYVERMRREYNCEVTVGAPEVAYREAITQRAEFNYTHKKQTGGSGQFARVAGYIEPIVRDPASEEEPKDFEFVNEVKGGVIPTEFIPSCEKGFSSYVTMVLRPVSLRQPFAHSQLNAWLH